MIRKLFKKLIKLYYTSSSERYISYMRKKGVRIGEDTVAFYPRHITIDVSRPELIEIGSHVFLHKNTTIMAHDWASWCFVEKYNDFIPSHGKIKIGNNVWLGEHVTILKGVTIGDNVVVGYGSIVTKDIPANSVAVGIPAKVICSLDEYYEKRKKLYVEECIEYAESIISCGREPKADDFYDDYPAFVNNSNMSGYKYPYHNIFKAHQLQDWREKHKSFFDGFDDFMEEVKRRKVH